jgi:hypothetical protein
MNLSLATPELDHDALRDILSPFSTTVRDEGYSHPPTKSWQPDFSTPSKEVYASTSSVTHQPGLSSYRETLPMTSYSQNKLASQLFSQLSSRKHDLLSSGDCFLYFDFLQISLCPPNYLLSFLPQRGCVGLNP